MTPLGTAEQRRLGFMQDGWTLTIASTTITRRTRMGGVGRPNIEAAAKRKDVVVIDVDDEVLSVSSESEEDQEDDSDGEVSDEKSTNPGKKPPHTRVILEVNHIEKAFAELGCPKCGGSIKPTVRTVCIASSLGFECMNQESSIPCHRLPQPFMLSATTITKGALTMP
jgi:hypothetical protein